MVSADDMLDIFLKTLPFFAVIAVGYWAGRTRFFSEEATAYLTKFVFYFALSAMLFRFSANLSLGDVFDLPFMLAYFVGTLAVYLIATLVALIRRISVEQTAIEAQCAVIGNIGFLGLPMLALLLGDASVGPIMMMLAVDLIFFGSLVVILITMIVSIVLGFTWSALSVPIPQPMNEFLAILGGAATPGALFAIGASLASKSAERMEVAGWLSFCKLILHPAAVAVTALMLFDVDRYAASVMIAAAALPVAGNVYMIAQHYGVAPQRVSASILISTAISIATVSLVIGWVSV